MSRGMQLTVSCGLRRVVRMSVEGVGRDAGQRQQAGHVFPAWNDAVFPAEPELARRPNLFRSPFKRKVAIETPPTKRVNVLILGHDRFCKLQPYALTRPRKAIGISIVSAKILQLIPMTEMPNRIRALRVAMTPKMSLEKLGGLVGVSRMTMSDLERGEIELTVSYMRKIAKALGVRPTDLMHVDDNPDALTSEERDLIHRLRAASDEERATLHRVTEAVLLGRDKQVA